MLARLARRAASSTPRATLESARSVLAEVSASAGSPRGSVELTMGHHAPFVGLLRLVNPAASNSVSLPMMLALSDHVDALEGWNDGRGLVVCSSTDSPSFCAGADLRGGSRFFEAEVGAAMNVVMTDALKRLAALPLISVAALHGPAVGGGAELALSCDYRLLSESGSMQFVHASRGVVPGWGGAAALQDIVGRRSALWLLASGTKLDCQGAAHFNLADNVLPDGRELVAAAVEFLAPLIHPSSSEVPSSAVVRGVKQALGRPGASPDERAAGEAVVFQRLWGGPSQMAFVASSKYGGGAGKAKPE